MKNIGLLALVAALLLLGGYYFLTKNDPAPEGTSGTQTDESGIVIDAEGDLTVETEPVGDPEFHALITYTDQGFDPEDVTIKKGQTVRFVNQASRDVWPASAIHPTHSIYPEKSADDCLGSSFDSCRGLKPGEFWEFTFNETGEWGYHDHLRASEKGTISVTE